MIFINKINTTEKLSIPTIDCHYIFHSSIALIDCCDRSHSSIAVMDSTHPLLWLIPPTHPLLWSIPPTHWLLWSIPLIDSCRLWVNCIYNGHVDTTFEVSKSTLNLSTIKRNKNMYIERRVSRNRFLVNKLVYGINLQGFTKVNEFPRFWGIGGACALSPMQWIPGPVFDLALK